MANSLFKQINDLITGGNGAKPQVTNSSIGGIPGPLSTGITPVDTALQTKVSDIQIQLSEVNDKLKYIKPYIIDGLDVYAYGSNNVYVTAGKAYTKDGIAIFTAIPNMDPSITNINSVISINTNTNGVQYILARGGQSQGFTATDTPDDTELIIAKVVINTPNAPIYDDLSQNGNYIVSGKDVLFNARFKIDDDTRMAFSGMLSTLLAENLYGSIKLSEGLSITNQQDSVRLDSTSMQIYNELIKTAEFNKDGVYFFQSNGQTLSHYGANGATIGSIQITPETLQSTNFKTGSRGFSINSDGNVEFNNITARGTIIARDGTIGKWSIARDRLTDTDDTSGMAPGITIGGNQYPFYAGSTFSNRATAPFRVTELGKLYATGVVINGSITANSGTIGGWTIQNGLLSGGVMQLYASGVINSTNFNVSNTGIISATSAILKSAIISGNITCTTLTANMSGTIGGWTISSNTITGGSTVLNANGNIHTSNFDVSTGGIVSATSAVLKSATVSGNITCSTLTANTAGTIGGFSITSTQLSAGNSNIVLHANSKYIAINNITYGSKGIQLQYNTGTPRFYVGDGVNSYIQHDGTKLFWKATNTELDSSGKLTCTGAVINGNITALSGNIGGWIIGATSLSSTNSKIRLDSSTNNGTIYIGNTASTHLQLIGESGGKSWIQSSNFDNSNANPKGFRFGSDGVIEAVDGVFRGKLQSNVFVKNEVNVAGGDIIFTTSTRLMASASAIDVLLTLESGVFVNNDLIKIGGSPEVMRVLTGSGTTNIMVIRNYNNSGASAINSKTPVFRVGKYGSLGEGYVELLGESTLIKIHDVSDNGGVMTDNTVVELGKLTQGTKVNQFGLYAQTAEISGNITATTLTTRSGIIGGWTIGSNTLAGGSTTLSATTGRITANSFFTSSGELALSKTGYTDDTAGIWLGNDNGIYKTNIGSKFKYIKWDGQQIEMRGTIVASRIEGRLVSEETLSTQYSFTAMLSGALVIVDDSGNGNSGAVSGYIRPVTGVIANGADLKNGGFDTGYSVDFSHYSSSNVYITSKYAHDFTDDVSIVLWTKFSDTSREQLHGHNDGSNRRLFIGTNNNSLKIGVGNTVVSGLVTIDPDQFVCLGLTVSASSKIYRTYYNGTYIASGTFTATGSSTKLFILGGLNSGTVTKLIDGVVDEFRIFTSVLDESDMALLYSNPTGDGIYIDSTINVDGNGSFTGSVDISPSNSGAYLNLNGINGVSKIFFNDGSTHNWELGTQVGNTTENLNLYNHTTSSVALSINKTTGSATFYDGLTVDNVKISGSAIVGITDANTVMTAYTGKAISIEGVLFDNQTISVAAGSVFITPPAGSSVKLDNTWSFDGNTVTSLIDANLVLTAYAGKAIAVEGVSFDGGVVTGATSITSTGFTGNLTGNVTGNVTGTAATVTGAAQASITSLGTLTTLTVDNITLDGSAITGISNANTTIRAYSGKVVDLESVLFDGGDIVMAASSSAKLYMTDQSTKSYIAGYYINNLYAGIKFYCAINDVQQNVLTLDYYGTSNFYYPISGTTSAFSGRVTANSSSLTDDNSVWYRKTFDIAMTTWATVVSFNPEGATQYGYGFIEINAGARVNTSGESGAKFSRWYYYINNGTVTVDQVGTDVDSGSPPDIRLSVSSNIIYVQVQSYNVTNSSFTTVFVNAMLCSGYTGSTSWVITE